MNSVLSVSFFCVVLMFGLNITAQTTPTPVPPPPAPARSQQPPPPRAVPTPRLSVTLAGRSNEKADQVSAEDRSLAFAKLLEGQRYTWIATRSQNRTRSSAAVRMARQALVASIDADPGLAEAYTSLAELEILLSPTEAEIDEAIALSQLAVKADDSNFGARRLMARLYSYKSKVGTSSFDRELGEKALTEWKRVSEFDKRNAEAWAFLSALYKDLDRSEQRLDALRNWVSSAAPVDTFFYRIVMGSQEALTTENALMKLGPALMEAGKTREAIEILSRLVADDPENLPAVEMLRDSIETVEGDDAQIATEALQQAVYANPDNLQLVDLLSKVYAQAGKIEESIKLFKNASERLSESDTPGASLVQLALGDLLVSEGRAIEAISVYENAVALRSGVGEGTSTAADREFLMRAYEKIIKTHAAEGNEKALLATVDKIRKVFGDKDLFPDRQLISYYREMGKKREALEVVRDVRKKVPEDLGFVRLEATLLTENGRVDEAVTLIKTSMSQKPKTAGKVDDEGATMSVSLPMQDEFSNYLFISNLYTQAGQAKNAIDAADHAFQIAQGAERKQIAKLTLASAQNLAGQHDAAEATLREILRQTPGNPIALNNLGYFLIERNVRLQEAKTMIEQAVKADPTNPSYLDSLGWAYFKLGDYASAEKHLKEAARFDPTSATIQEHLGDVYDKQKKSDLARSAWERSVKLASDPADIKRVKTKLNK